MVVPLFLLYLVLSILVYWISIKIYKTSINPLFCVVGIFMFALCLFYAADFIDHDLSQKTITIYVLGLSFFCAGLIISKLLNNQNIGIIKDYDNHSKESTFEKQSHKKIVNFGATIVIICTLLTLYYIIAYVGIGNYLRNIILSNKEMLATSYVFLINEWLKKTLLVFSPMIITYMLKYKESKKLCIILTALSFLVTLTYNRVMFFYLLIIDSCAFYFYRFSQEGKRVKFRTKIVLIVILIVFISYFMNTEVAFNKAVRSTGTIGNYSVNSDQLTMILYFMGTIKSSDIYISSNMSSLPLAATFRYVYELFGVNTSSSVEAPFVNIPIRYNTGVAEFYLYREGGILWLIFWSTILGWIIGVLFEDYRRLPSCDKITTISFLSMCMLMAIRSYLPMYLEFWIPFIILIYIRTKMRKARRMDYNINNQRGIVL